ncbi:TPA: tail fiber protein [Citrobacter amalonaticus]
MYWLDNNSGKKVMPQIPSVVSTEPLFFHEGGNGEPPARPGAHWYNIVQSELLNVVMEGGQSPDKFKHNQLSLAIKQLIKNKTDLWSKNTFPDWSTEHSPYIRGVVVKYNNSYWVSLVNNNAAKPGTDDTKWQVFIFERADVEDVNAGTDPNLIITPPVLKQVISAFSAGIAPLTVPVGGAMLWFTSVPPDGWLEANGQTFNKTENPKLAAVYPSGKLPDCRGYFLRGWDHGAGVDADKTRPVGGVQGDALQNITGKFPAGYHRLSYSLTSGPPAPLVDGAFTGETYGWWAGQDGTKSEVRLYHFDASRVVRTATETRGKNMAVMVIIKTDKVEASAGDTSPTSIILSPDGQVINAGQTKQFTATVLPSSLAATFPVTWTVADASLGSVSSNGLYTATAGKSGTQTIIASVSSGLSDITTLTQYVYDTAISFAAIPGMKTGETYTPVLTRTPAGATEPLVYSSSDNSVAAFINGVITAYGAGTATLTVTGQYSGVSASRNVTVTAVVVPETYLKISNNFSEIEAAGSTAQAEARENLGIPDPSTTGAGRLLKCTRYRASATHVPQPETKFQIVEAVGGVGGHSAYTPVAGKHTTLLPASSGAYAKVMTGPGNLTITMNGTYGTQNVTVWNVKDSNYILDVPFGGYPQWSESLDSGSPALSILCSDPTGIPVTAAADSSGRVLDKVLAKKRGNQSIVLLQNGYMYSSVCASSEMGEAGRLYYSTGLVVSPPGPGAALYCDATLTVSNRPSGVAAHNGTPGAVIVWEYA